MVGNNKYSNIVNPYKKQKSAMALLRLLLPKKPVVNPYKKKPKTFAVFNRNQRRTGMPQTTQKKKTEVIVHNHRQTGCGKGKIVSTHNTNAIWKLPNNKVLVQSQDSLFPWQLSVGGITSTVGKYELKKVLIELHLMGFWWRQQHGTHHSCRDNKEAFHHTMDVLHQVLIEDKEGHCSLGKFTTKEIELEEIQHDDYNRQWDVIIKLMVQKVSEKYKIGGV
jgi:hypothetical protein